LAIEFEVIDIGLHPIDGQIDNGTGYKLVVGDIYHPVFWG
jgi:hypothetical protein